VAFAQASAGVSTASGLTYSEVGNFVFGIDTVYDDSFTAVDATKASPECTSDFSNTANANGMFGCMFGNAAALNVGRFVPDHFDTTVVQVGGVPMACATGLTCPLLFNGMVYSGQPFKFTVTAKNAGSATTLNYDTTLGFAKTTNLTVWDGLGSTTPVAAAGAGTLGVTSPASFTAGVATEAAEKYTFTATPSPPTNIYIRAIDTDAVSSLRTTNPTTTSVEGGVKVVSGRIKVSNAYGSELLPLTLSATVQYYNAAGSWVTSLTDSATALAFKTSYTVGSGATAVTLTPLTGIVSAGSLSIKLGKPTLGGGSTPAITPTTKPSYLLPVDGQATFGIYKGNSNFIYMRESY
jgi:MSHA biogenesis protein MshQ